MHTIFNYPCFYILFIEINERLSSINSRQLYIYMDIV